MRLLVTGGCGYIGSHTCIELLNAGYEVVVLDNLCNSSQESLRRVEQICGKAIQFEHGDVRDCALLEQLFDKYEFDAVLHFAGLKAVAESMEQPLTYYENNVIGTLTLCRAMASANVHTLIYSSSATVYGEPAHVPIGEDSPVGSPTNAYGRSKLMVEGILSDLARSDKRWRVALLRYFNPAGAHESGLIGEDPKGTPNNLIPFMSQVAIGKRSSLAIYGNDYPTPDGTGIRDYIHVVDLGRGHLRALQALREFMGVNVWNLGTGKGYSVLQIKEAFEKASGCSVPYTIEPRRAGDIAECWADASKAHQDLGWQPEYGLQRMMYDSWRWQKQNQE